MPGKALPAPEIMLGGGGGVGAPAWGVDRGQGKVLQPVSMEQKHGHASGTIRSPSVGKTPPTPFPPPGLVLWPQPHR